VQSLNESTAELQLLY